MSHFFTPFFFYVLEEWLSNKLHVRRSRDSVRNGCAARIRSIRSFRGLGKLHQQAISRRYYLGTACRFVNFRTCDSKLTLFEVEIIL